MPARVPLAAMIVLIASSSSIALAQEPSPPSDLDRVEVVGIKDPVIIPYKRAYEIATRVRAAGEGRVELQVRLTSKSEDKPVPGLTVYVVGDSVHVPALLSPTGFFAIPLDEQAYAEGADFIVNQPKGVLRTRVALVPKFPPDRVTYGDVEQTARLGREARAAVLPWYLRAITPTVNGLGLCFEDLGHVVTIEASVPIRREAGSRETDDSGAKLWCADFKDGDALAPADAPQTADGTFRPVFLESVF